MSEQLPPLNMDKDGKPEPTFWAGERDEVDDNLEGEEETIHDRTDERLSPSREELSRLALEMKVPSAAVKLPPVEGPDTYHG